MAEVLGQVGHYELLRQIGRGGMATVFLARHLKLGREDALKRLNGVQLGDQTLSDRFLRESRLGASLNHERIVTVYDFFEEDGTPYISMEYLSRGSLRPHIGHMTIDQTISVLRDLLDALECAEGQAIVHRDLKPENVLLSDTGRAKIADFGIAKAMNFVTGGTELTATGTAMGTPTYMSPEQAQAHEVSSATDRYALGVMAYEMVAGAPPYGGGDTPMSLLYRHVYADVPSLADAADVHSEFAEWIERLLSKDPKDRFSGAAEARAELHRRLPAILAGDASRRSLPSDVPAAPTDGYETFVDEVRKPTPDAVVVAPESDQPAAEAEIMHLTDAPDEFGFHVAVPDTEEVAEAAPPVTPAPVEPPAPTHAEPTPVEAPAPTHAEPTPVKQPAPARAEPTSAEAPTLPPRRPLPDEVPTPEARPPAAEEQPVPRSLRAPLLIVAVGVACGIVLALLLRSDPSEAPQPTTSAETPDLSVTLPASWQPLIPVPTLRGLRVHDALARQAPDAGTTTFVAGRSQGDGPTLLPPALLKHLEGDVDGEHVKLGDVDALRYTGLRPDDLPELDVYAIPTDDGVMTIACYAARPGRSFDRATCERIASSVELRRAAAFDIAPDPEHGAVLSKIFDDLDRGDRRAQEEFDDARTNERQAAAARRVASVHEEAARALRELDPSPAVAPAVSEAATALRDAATAARDIARAAEAERGRDYDRARAAFRSAKRELRPALGELAQSGYTIAGAGG